MVYRFMAIILFVLISVWTIRFAKVFRTFMHTSVYLAGRLPPDYLESGGHSVFELLLEIIIMSRSLIAMPDAVITNATSDSQSFLSTLTTDDATAVTFHVPAAVVETITIVVSTDGGTTFPYTLQNNAADITLPGGKSTTVTVPLGRLWRLHSGVAVAGTRTIPWDKEIFISGHQ